MRSLASVESQFVRTTNKLFYVQAEDDVLIRQSIEQLIEFLNDAFGALLTHRALALDGDEEPLFGPRMQDVQHIPLLLERWSNQYFNGSLAWGRSIPPR